MSPLMTPLCELARKHKTDKGGFHLTYGNHPTEICHNYTPVYYELFAGREQEVRRVLEIGINQGCSQRMWAEHFPKADIVGIDIDVNYLFTEGRIRSYLADQGSHESLMAAIDRACMNDGNFDLIVDDGSHEVYHQIASMKSLLPLIADDGFYVIEDLNCEPREIIEQIPIEYIARVHLCAPGLGRAEFVNEPLVVIRRA